MMGPAATLKDAIERFDLGPLDFAGGDAQPFYVDPPPPDGDEGGLNGPGPVETIKRALLETTSKRPQFLAGHIGSGKSTQLNRLAADPEIVAAFTVVHMTIEAELAAFLDRAQLLFFLAAQIYELGRARGLLAQDGKWQEHLATIDAQVFGERGLTAPEGSLGVEYNLVFVKLRQELKLNEHARKQFRAFGETQQTRLIDLLRALIAEVHQGLVAAGDGRELLVLVDDLDKVRGADQQRSIFDEGLALLFSLDVRIVLTVPSAVAFAPRQQELRQRIEHLYPVRVLDKAPGGFDPEKAFIDGADGFFRRAVDHRVDAALFDDAAVRLAAIYSGGVLREFFRLLVSAIRIAQSNRLEVVDARAVRAAVNDERRRETMGLLASDYDALRAVHETLALATEDDRAYLDQGRVLECYNDKTWYEVNPLLWKHLAPR